MRTRGMTRHASFAVLAPITLLAVLLAVLLAGPPASAQAKRSDVALTFEKASGLSSQQQLAAGERLLQKMKDSLRRGFRLLEQARSEKDIVKLNAIDEILSSMKGLLKVSEAAYVALQEAVARKDRETADHEYTKIAIAAQKIEALAVQAEGAVGGQLVQSGQTELDVTAEGMAPEGDVPTGGAGADIPAGAGAGAAGAAAAIAGGGETQTPPDDSDADADPDADAAASSASAGTIDEPPPGADTPDSGDFAVVPPTDVTQPSASPTQ